MARRQTPAAITLAVVAATAPLAVTAPWSRASVIDGVQAVAADQPQVHFYLASATDPTPLVASDGEGGTGIDVQAYLDTGSSGILLSQETAAAFNLSSSTYSTADNTSTVTYYDTGIAGGAGFGVSAPLRLALAPLLGTSNDVNFGGDPPTRDQYGPLSDPVRLQISNTPADDLVGPLDIVGTTLLPRNVVVVDARGLNGFIASTGESGDTLHTYVYPQGTPYKPATADTDPGIPTVNRHVRLSLASFAGFTVTTPAGAAGPTLADNPVIGPDPVLKFQGKPQANPPPPVTLTLGGQTSTGSFLLDTGAQASFISVAEAAAVGVHYKAGTEGTDNPVLVTATGAVVPDQFDVPVGGIGGTVTAAGFFLDALSLPTVEGDPITFTHAPVLVTDVTVTDPTTGRSLTLDGDLGMNFLVASYSADFNAAAGGAFDWITYDQSAGLLGLQLPGATTVAAAVTVPAAGRYVFAPNPGTGVLTLTVPGLTVAAGGVAVLPAAAPHADRQLLVVTGTGLSLAGTTNAWTGTLDVGNDDLDLPVASLATVTNQARQGYAGGTWNGPGGLTSSAAAADATRLTAVGVIQNNQGGAPIYSAAHPFDGTAPGTADVLVKYTYYGDANLDGVVNGADYGRIDAGYNSRGSLTGWYNGDFNYDGRVDGSDYTLIDDAFNRQTDNLSSAALSSAALSSAALSSAALSSAASTAEVAGRPGEGGRAVPEPSVAWLAGVGLVARRRRPRTPTLGRPFGNR